MSITIDLPPAVMQEATAFAESHNTTLEQFVIESIDAEMNRRRDATEWMARLDALVEKTGARLTGEPYKFNRADAYPDEILSEDLADGQVYCGVKAVNPFK